MSDAVSKTNSVSHPVAELANISIGFSNQCAVSSERANANHVHRLIPDNRSDALQAVKDYLDRNDQGQGLLQAINQPHGLTYSTLSTAMKEYFKTEEIVSFDIAKKFIDAVIRAEGVDAREVLDTLTSAAESYFIDTIATESVTQAFMQAFLYLKDRSPSDEFKQLVGDALWSIYFQYPFRSYVDKNLFLGAGWIMIDANLQFDQWREEKNVAELIWMAESYCSINKPDEGRLKALIDAIGCDLADDSAAKFEAIFVSVAMEYFFCNATDVSATRLIIEAVSGLFEEGEVYDKHSFFSRIDTIFDDLPENIQLPHALTCCIACFFYKDEEYVSDKHPYWLPEEQNGRKTPRVLSELIAALWKKEAQSYDIIALARSIYQADNDVRRQLCLVESLTLLEEQQPRHLPAAIDLPTAINSVLDFYLTQLKSDPESIQALLSLAASGGYSARCKSYLVNAIARQFAFFSGSEETVSVNRIMTTYFSSGHCDPQLSDNFMLAMSHCSEHLAGQEAFSALVNNLEHYILHEHIDPEITKAVVRKLIEFNGVDYHNEIRQTLINLSEKDETDEFGEIVLSVLPDR